MKRITLDVDYIVNEYSAGRSVLDLASQLGVSRNVIDRRLKSRGITPRGGSEASFIRMSKLSAEERSALAANAHAAIKGTKRSFETLVKCALAKQASRSSMSEIEEKVCAHLRRFGVDPIPQLAVGPYNCDLACYPVAVEVFGGHWHFSGRHLARSKKRIRDFGDAGWHVLMIVINERVPCYRFSDDTADYIAAYVQEARRNPSIEREYRVIDCRGKTLVAGRCNDDHISIVPPATYGRNANSRSDERIAG